MMNEQESLSLNIKKKNFFSYLSFFESFWSCFSLCFWEFVFCRGRRSGYFFSNCFFPKIKS